MAEVKEQAGKILTNVAGYVATRTLDMGISKGLFAAIQKHDGGATVKGLAEDLGYDAFYLEVWLRSAVASDLLVVSGPDEKYDARTRRFEDSPERRFSLAEHMDKLLLDTDFPGYVGALPAVMKQKEFFDLFEENLESGKRLWWEDCTPELIQAVSNTGWSFYVRMIPAGLEKVPGLKEKLDNGANIVELCCGAGKGTLRLASTFPKCNFVSVDGDGYSLKLSRERLDKAGVGDRVDLIHSPLEDMELPKGQDMVFINISMHECRDIDKVMENIKACLKPGGHLVISDFPFPETVEAQKSVPGRLMSGIQFFEALIDDQLMPTAAFVALLEKHGFNGISTFDLTGVHTVTHGLA